MRRRSARKSASLVAGVVTSPISTPHRRITSQRIRISASRHWRVTSRLTSLRWWKKHGIAYHEKTLGQLFCDGSAQQIIDMLLAECEAAGVTIQLDQAATHIAKTEDGFQVTLADGSVIKAEKLVIATGGPSIPKMGATGWGYGIAEQFGLSVIPPRAALVPFTLDDTLLADIKPLAGVSLDAIVSCNGMSFREGMLFTHRGLSGPSILQISSYWHEGDDITINLTPDIDALDALKTARETTPKIDVQSFMSQTDSEETSAVSLCAT